MRTDTYYVTVSAEHSGLRKGGDPTAPSQGCFGLLGRGHIRNEGRDDAADELAKTIDYQD